MSGGLRRSEYSYKGDRQALSPSSMAWQADPEKEGQIHREVILVASTPKQALNENMLASTASVVKGKILRVYSCAEDYE